MKTQELLELAALDALGLLDEHEHEAFDRAFRAASPALQAQIRSEQTRIAKDDSLLPEVDAPLGLKAKVLARWREAVAARRRFVPPLLPSSGVTPIWRMAAIGALAATMVMGVATLQIHSNFKQLAAAANDLKVSQAFSQEFGQSFEHVFMNPNVEKVSYRPVEGFEGQVAMLLDRTDAKPSIDNPEVATYTGHFYCRLFPESASNYQIVLVRKDGSIVTGNDGKPRVIDTFAINNETGTKRQMKISITVEEVEQDYDLAIIHADHFVAGNDPKIIGKLLL